MAAGSHGFWLLTFPTPQTEMELTTYYVQEEVIFLDLDVLCRSYHLETAADSSRRGAALNLPSSPAGNYVRRSEALASFPVSEAYLHVRLRMQCKVKRRWKEALSWYTQLKYYYNPHTEKTYHTLGVGLFSLVWR